MKVYHTDIQNGNLIVKNVPHIQYPSGIGVDGEKGYIAAPTMLKLSLIFKYMIKNKINELDYDEQLKW